MTMRQGRHSIRHGVGYRSKQVSYRRRPCDAKELSRSPRAYKPTPFHIFTFYVFQQAVPAAVPALAYGYSLRTPIGVLLS